MALISYGPALPNALAAAELLEKDAIHAQVINMHTIKPLDLDTLEQARNSHRLLVSLEEHNIVGGLGGAIAEYLSSVEGSPRLIRMGIPDAYCAAGSQKWIWEQNGIDSASVAQRIEEEL